MEPQPIPQVSQYGSVDPAPPEPVGNVDAWRSTLLDETIPLFHRMRAVFSLRNHRSNEACLALCDGFDAKSALLRHEIAYVLGQMQNNVALPTLTERLEDNDEHVMVRHEAAEAMGAIGDVSVVPTLRKHALDPQPEVSESCEVALDLLKWVASAEFENADW